MTNPSFKHMTKEDAGKTLLIRAIEHVSSNMWESGENGIPTPKDGTYQTIDLLRSLELSIEPSFEWCCLPWSAVVAHAHKENAG